jgi:hypothetical protein
VKLGLTKDEREWCSCNGLDLVRCLVWISAGTPVIVAEDIRCFCQFLQESPGAVPWLGEYILHQLFCCFMVYSLRYGQHHK